MTGTFGDAYAASYDYLYADKDYESECDLLEEIFRSSGRTVRSVLDLGCGTGAHAVRLAMRGYAVVGVDVAPAMLAGAQDRAEQHGQSIELIEGDIRTIHLDRTFDAVICMFAVMGYQTTDEDVARALTTARGHLVAGGPFVFDVWYGPAVEGIGPSTRTKTVPTADGEVERQASATLGRDEQLCTVSYRLVERRADGEVRTSNESHRMRYFFRDGLERFLGDAGFTLTSLSPFPETTAPLSDETWNVLAVAG